MLHHLLLQWSCYFSVSTGEGSTKNLLLMANSPKEKQKWIDYIKKKIILHKRLDAESSNISSS